MSEQKQYQQQVILIPGQIERNEMAMQFARRKAMNDIADELYRSVPMVVEVVDRIINEPYYGYDYGTKPNKIYQVKITLTPVQYRHVVIPSPVFMNTIEKPKESNWITKVLRKFRKGDK